MLRGLPGFDTKLVLVETRPWALLSLGRAFSCSSLIASLAQSMTQVGISIFWIGPPVHHLLARLQLCPLVPRVAHLVYLDDMQRCKCNAIKGKT